MLDLDFTPSTLTVAAGASVKFTNNGVAPHTATARDRSFDSGTMEAGDVYRHTFAGPGAFPYICAIHPQMTGTICGRVKNQPSAVGHRRGGLPNMSERP